MRVSIVIACFMCSTFPFKEVSQRVRRPRIGIIEMVSMTFSKIKIRIRAFVAKIF